MSHPKELEEDWEDMEDYDSDLPVCNIVLEEGEGKPWASKLGGCPYLLGKEDYPIGKNKKPMLFLAQINLEDVHNMPELPDHGLLQFFVEQDQEIGLTSSPVVRWIEKVMESEENLLKEHPYADEEYFSELPFEQPGMMHFEEGFMSDEVEENCRIGGYPYFPQDGELDLEEEFLLLQLTDQSECGLCFGDCGVCYFIIEREDLANRDFSKISYGYQSC